MTMALAKKTADIFLESGENELHLTLEDRGAAFSLVHSYNKMRLREQRDGIHRYDNTSFRVDPDNDCRIIIRRPNATGLPGQLSLPDGKPYEPPLTHIASDDLLSQIAELEEELNGLNHTDD